MTAKGRLCPRKRAVQKGLRFGKLVIIGDPYIPESVHNSMRHVLCQCDCGATDVARVSRLFSGEKKACRSCSWSAANRKHGDSESAEFKTWLSVLHRSGKRADGSSAVSKSKSAAARSVRKHYWGRGIDMDPRWLSYETFLTDMGRRPAGCSSLDRIDNERGYWPDNCRWATHHEQMGNTRKTIRITHAGKTLALAAWARELRLGPDTLRIRYKSGSRPPDLFLPVQQYARRKKG